MAKCKKCKTKDGFYTIIHDAKTGEVIKFRGMALFLCKECFPSEQENNPKYIYVLETPLKQIFDIMEEECIRINKICDEKDIGCSFCDLHLDKDPYCMKKLIEVKMK